MTARPDGNYCDEDNPGKSFFSLVESRMQGGVESRRSASGSPFCELHPGGIGIQCIYFANLMEHKEGCGQIL